MLFLVDRGDDHAEDILRILREEWPLSNEQAVTITCRVEREDDAGTVDPISATSGAADAGSADAGTVDPISATSGAADALADEARSGCGPRRS